MQEVWEDTKIRAHGQGLGVVPEDVYEDFIQCMSSEIVFCYKT